MKKIQLGFFKKPQGVFTKEIITQIENRLAQHKNITLKKDLDFSQGYLKNGSFYINNFNLNTLDAFFWHDTVKPADWKGDNYFLHLLSTLEKDCLVINSSQSTQITNDKFLAHSVLQKNNLPVADFALVDSTNTSALIKIFNAFGKTILIKPRFGGWGTGIIKVTSQDQLLSTLELLASFSTEKKQIFIEKYYPNDLSKWISVVVMGSKVVFGYQKTNQKTSTWKIYDPQKIDGKGFYSTYIKPSPELKSIALKAKEAIGKDIIGFDFIFTKEGYKIIDENGRPGLYQQCWDKAHLNIVDEIVDLILTKLKPLL